MTESIHSDVTDLSMAYRLLLKTKVLEARYKGDKAAEKAALNDLEKDDVEISSEAKAANSVSGAKPADSTLSNVDINLSELIKQIRGGQLPIQTDNLQTTQVIQFEQTIETEATFTYHQLESVNGLVLRNRNLAETDRYQFEFMNGSTLKITDKWSNKSTTIWGDPHIDTSDEAGENNGDFKDLKGSDQYTTFMLSDGTRLTITAKDSGIIEKVDIFNGSQHLHGLGSGAKEWNEKIGLFASPVKEDASLAISLVPVGDVVYAGGDGNDWFDAAHRLVWGKTTGPIVTSRPSSYIEFQINQRVTQQLSILQIDQAV